LLGEANSIIEHCQAGFNWLGSICLAAFGTVEEHPHREIPGEVLKAVFDPCGCEQNVMRTERLALSAANKLTCALRYDIDLIAGVRSLWIASPRRIELDDQRAVLKERH